MFALDRALAQDIVDRAMAILPYNVNVMDYLGIIIGSGDPERLCTRHEGAQRVLANRQVVEIDSQAALQLGGVKPGVNLPLMLDHQLVGVLGITGEPDEVRVYGELVKMTAEMLMEHRRQQADLQWRAQRSEDLLARLLLPDCPDSMVDEARQLGLQPHVARQVVLIQFDQQGQVASQVATWLGTRYADSWCVLREPTLLYWCRATGKERDDALLLKQFDEHRWPVLRMATVAQSADLPALRHACAAARDLLDYASQALPGQRLLRLEAYRLPVLFWRYRHDWLAEDVAEPIGRLHNHVQLLDTLCKWFEYSGESQACAEALGIHRNSLRYRLEKIGELTGCDPYKTNDLLRLYLGAQMITRHD
ncbi:MULTISPECIES: sugar diacid recognition domain-containing protein [Pseudomonas syringae group]|uniref:Putative sugar diacid recognition n=2 Tax=Pseudomonas syringae group TaxID=136849 RepID=A0A0N8R834_PSESX|nr:MULTISPECIES: sugar diacid recognition domain-containing protein [Pseudomonas syringae group]KPX02479.1 putative sugar diacid recognition [Pseudomonas syringae pv. cerasicola]KWS91757.1 CdaR family transcriptional regulator [Pseudomonas syringae pv. cerasicola]PHN81161.1 CdaR family transcriptional regulator [Pseudomonas syringae pv. cerasicola]PHN81807.1 CdaR family transcriptional regulator [Pseudomonas syringae pv. cerasicola]RMS80027.1 putative sugar diacid recognition [Pseudomonas sava